MREIHYLYQQKWGVDWAIWAKLKLNIDFGFTGTRSKRKNRVGNPLVIVNIPDRTNILGFSSRFLRFLIFNNFSFRVKRVNFLLVIFQPAHEAKVMVLVGFLYFFSWARKIISMFFFCHLALCFNSACFQRILTFSGNLKEYNNDDSIKTPSAGMFLRAFIG